jgi:hypothetical protein
MALKIIIKDSNTTTKELTLDPIDPPAKKLQKVKWVIEDEKVASFRIEEKEDSDNIFAFFDQPPSGHVKEGGARVGLPRNEAVYNYTIVWKATNGDPNIEYRFDPKISIDPSQANLILLISSIVGILGIIIYWRMNRFNRKKKP